MPSRIYERSPSTKWRARIKYDGRYLVLGRFDTWEEAFEVEEQARDRYGINRNLVRIKRPKEPASASC